MSSRATKTPSRARQDIRSTSCFYCSYIQQKCERLSGGSFCERCVRKAQSLVEEAPSLHESCVRMPLHRLVDEISRQLGVPTPCFITLQIVTRQKGEKAATKPREREYQIPMDQPFNPRNAAVTQQMDSIVWNNLSLKMKCTDNTSRLVELASLAGGYLCLIFPVVDRSDQRSQLGFDWATKQQPERDIPKSHIVKFSVLRFGELLEELMVATRGLSNNNFDRNQMLNVIAAAGVLYCEVEYINQGFQSGKLGILCVDEVLESSLKMWLKSVGKELLLRLQNMCGKAPTWSENLQRPQKRAKRQFDKEIIRSISATFGKSLLSPTVSVATSESSEQTQCSPSAAPTLASAYTTPTGSPPATSCSIDSYQRRECDFSSIDVEWEPTSISDSGSGSPKTQPSSESWVSTQTQMPRDDSSHYDDTVLPAEFRWEGIFDAETIPYFQNVPSEDVRHHNPPGSGLTLVPPLSSQLFPFAEKQSGFYQTLHVSASRPFVAYEEAATSGKVVGDNGWPGTEYWDPNQYFTCSNPEPAHEGTCALL